MADIDAYLVADTRERYVHDFLKTCFAEAGVPHTVAQLTVGDYLVCRRIGNADPEILACVERKTLKDFAASFRDGRYDNLQKMLDLRRRTGCQLYFFVEGPAFPENTWKVSRLPYGNILAAMTMMMVRDGVFVVQTKDTPHTARRLLDFTRAFSKVGAPFVYPVVGGSTDNADAVGSTNDDANEGSIVDATTGGNDGTDDTDEGSITDGTTNDNPPVPEEAMGSTEKPLDALAAAALARLPGVSLATARHLLKSYSIQEFAAGVPDEASIRTLQTPGGRALLARARRSLTLLAGRPNKEHAKVLSGVPGISLGMATELLGGRSLGAFLSYGADAVSIATIQQRGRSIKLGKPRASRIFRVMGYADRDA